MCLKRKTNRRFWPTKAAEMQFGSTCAYKFGLRVTDHTGWRLCRNLVMTEVTSALKARVECRKGCWGPGLNYWSSHLCDCEQPALMTGFGLSHDQNPIRRLRHRWPSLISSQRQTCVFLRWVIFWVSCFWGSGGDLSSAASLNNTRRHLMGN